MTWQSQIALQSATMNGKNNFSSARRSPKVGIRRGVYDTATKGSLISDHAEYCRLRRESGCDPFLGVLKLDDESSVLNSAFDESIEEDSQESWLECFQDLTQFSSNQFPNPETSVESVLDLAAAEVDWHSWSKFLDDDISSIQDIDHPLGSGGSSPLSCGSTCSDSYIPNMFLDSIEVKKEESPKPACISYLPKLSDTKDELILMKDQKPVINNHGFAFEPLKSEFKALILPKPRPIIMRPVPKVKFSPRPSRPYTPPIGRRNKQRSRDPPIDRRRELNRDAALRYRERKKAETLALKVEHDELESHNKWLHSRTSHLRMEVERMRSQLKDLGALV